MTDFVQISTTTNTRHDADRIAAELVRRRLAACVQVVGPMTSTFRWQGKVETAEEWLCQVKTTHECVEPIRKALEELHPYEVPEFLVLSIEDGSEAYLKWLGEQVGEGL